MIRLHVIEPARRAAYADALDQHHRMRKLIYVDRLGWRALTAVDGREVDQFDHEEAVYLLALDDEGVLVGGTRLLPSLGPTLLSETFPGLAALRGFERASHVWEWTRFFVDPARRGEGRLSPEAGVVAAGIVEHCLAAGITHLQAVGETYWISKTAELGWRPRPLGLPIEHDGMHVAAFRAEMTEGALEVTRRVYRVTGSVLARAHAPIPARRPGLPDRAPRARAS